MAAKGSCVSNILRRGDIIALKWTLTGDGNGDADENGSADVEWFLGPVYGEVVGVEIEYTDASNGYDLYIKDHMGIDILKGQGVGLANDAADAGNRFCPTNKSQDIGTATNAQGSPIILWNETLEAIGDDMGNGLISAITVFVRLFPRHDMHAVH